ncbi:MAG TPA: hypothetical protein VLN42_01805 [Casimicrobiaceae bacterium]|nr:hypothetical protein [Casimicrobiaceae bacterium]
MDARDASLPEPATPNGGAYRLARHALAILLAAALAWFVFAAYSQPGFILDFAGMRLC